MKKHAACLLSLCLLAAAQPDLQEGAAAQDEDPFQGDPILNLLRDAFREQGIRLDVEGKVCAVPANICIREDLLEYLVVGPTSSGALMTAYDPEGRIVGERFAATFEELLHVLESAALRGTAEPSRAIPQDAPSALIWLDQRS